MIRPLEVDNIDKEIKEDDGVQSENSETEYEYCEDESNESTDAEEITIVSYAADEKAKSDIEI